MEAYPLPTNSSIKTREVDKQTSHIKPILRIIEEKEK
jgi:hypothetical protein